LANNKKMDKAVRVIRGNKRVCSVRGVAGYLADRMERLRPDWRRMGTKINHFEPVPCMAPCTVYLFSVTLNPLYMYA
jgi:hypothetical protein